MGVPPPGDAIKTGPCQIKQQEPSGNESGNRHDNFGNVTLFRFFIQTKTHPQRSINHSEFSKSAKFHENPLQTHGIMGAQIFAKKCMPRGTRLIFILSFILMSSSLEFSSHFLKIRSLL